METQPNHIPDPDGVLPAGLAETQVKLEELNQRALAFARANPVPCLVGALALGFIVGKIAARY